MKFFLKMVLTVGLMTGLTFQAFAHEPYLTDDQKKVLENNITFTIGRVEFYRTLKSSDAQRSFNRQVEYLGSLLAQRYGTAAQSEIIENYNQFNPEEAARLKNERHARETRFSTREGVQDEINNMLAARERSKADQFRFAIYTLDLQMLYLRLAQ